MVNSNDEYITKAKDILKVIIASGYDAYIVGEAVRNLILEKKIEYIDIFTNISREQAASLFEKYNISTVSDKILVRIEDYKFFLNFSKEYNLPMKAKVRKTRRHYSTSLMEYLTEKFYVVNTLAMGANNIIYDCYDAKTDLGKRKIKAVCENPSCVYINEPLKMLDAMILLSETGFKLDKTVIRSIKSKAKNLKKIDYSIMTAYLVKIFSNKYAKKAIYMMYYTNMYKYMGIFNHEIKRLAKNYHKQDIDMTLAISMVKDKKYYDEVGKYSSNDYNLQMLVNLAITNPKSNYDTFTLFSNSIDNLIKANYINYILGRTRKKQRKIKKAYNNLPVKKSCDLAFKGEDILKLGLDVNADFMYEVMDEVIALILEGKLSNDYNQIKTFVIGKIELNKSNNINNVTNELNNNIPNINTSSNSEFNSGVNLNTNPNTNMNPNMNDYNRQNTFNTNRDYDYKNSNEDLSNRYNSYDSLNTIKNESVGFDYEGLRRHQEELDKRLKELERQNLEKDLELDIERKIKQSGMLDELTGISRESTYQTLHKAYYDILINSDKYRSLNNLGENDGNN